MHIGFLLNHYTAHQLYHSVPIAYALSSMRSDVKVTIIASNSLIYDQIKQLGSLWPEHKASLVLAKVPFYINWADHLLKKYVFIRKSAVLKHNRALFKDMDALVVPEKNSLSLQKYEELKHLKFIRIRHGAGDRSTGLDASNKKFDMILASGQKMQDRLIQDQEITADKIKVIGYPKLDVINNREAPKPLFNNSNPTIVYNPHFKISESSWIKMGKQILDFFNSNTDYNLIFAPHVVLYERAKRHGAFPLKDYKNNSNIHIDTGSIASVDMTYTRLADVYIGDVSSQVYEFLVYKKRPCIFLNTHEVKNWEDKETFLHWKAGQVIDDISQLEHALAACMELHDQKYFEKQKELVNYTFDVSDEASSERAAQSIIDLLEA